MVGFSSSAFTDLHVAISVIGIVAGAVVAANWLRGRTSVAWTAAFLLTTVLTSVTGFMFRSTSFGPPHVVGAISLLVLAVACGAYYGRSLHGPWRRVYIVTALVALYLNVFVAIVQAFAKIPTLRALAPTQTEPSFLVAQATTLVLFAALTIVAARRGGPATGARIRAPASAG